MNSLKIWLCQLGFQITNYTNFQIFHVFLVKILFFFFYIQIIYIQSNYKTNVKMLFFKNTGVFQTRKMLLFLPRSNMHNDSQMCCPRHLPSAFPERAKGRSLSFLKNLKCAELLCLIEYGVQAWSINTPTP